ncbi:hypothetical protein Acr_01g0009290 [Actinidia rufa]|uniref:Integrase catalytic domain-containing protein n=1 Tax=Actinidia rufa TaxID=165716 RepID=A0A7J0E3X5_9ERIC|nr:hypothetical protein Acr_01g0009290 [Actinidia rufa]
MYELIQKKNVKNAHNRAEEEIYNLSSPFVDAHPPITFNNDDLRGLHLPYDNALVVSAVIANFNVQRILVNNGSSADILFVSTFDKMKIGLDKLHLFHTPLVRFGGNMMHPLGWIKLPVTLGTEPHQTTVWQDFIVVDFPLPYNAILGRLTLGGTRTITLTYHLKMKFPTSTGVGEGDVLGIDSQVAIHKLFTNPEYLTIRQKQRKSELSPYHDELTQKYLQGAALTKRVAALNRFVSKSTDKSQGISRFATIAHYSYHRQRTFRVPVHLAYSSKCRAYPRSRDRPRMAIKAQALAYFVVESTHETAPEPEATPPKVDTQSSNVDLARWMLIVDKSSNQHSYGAGLVLQTPSGEQIENDIRIGFKATNNKVEYETLLAGLRVAAELGVDSLDRFQDSTNPREENKKADALDKLTSAFDFISDGCVTLVFLASPSIEIVDLVLQMEESPTWMDEILVIFGMAHYHRTKSKLSVSNIVICSDLAIAYHFSSPSHPQANGQVEVTNRTILRNLKARLERSKSRWAEKLPSILWTYHTTSRIPTSEMSYSMVFGTKSIILVEIGMLSFKTSNFNKDNNEIKLRFNLNLLNEKRDKAKLRQATYKCRVAKYYNQRVKNQSFLLGDLVLRNVTLSTKEPNTGKLGPTWEDPYKVIKLHLYYDYVIINKISKARAYLNYLPIAFVTVEDVGKNSHSSPEAKKYLLFHPFMLLGDPQSRFLSSLTLK